MENGDYNLYKFTNIALKYKIFSFVKCEISKNIAYFLNNFAAFVQYFYKQFVRNILSVLKCNLKQKCKHFPILLAPRLYLWYH